MYDKILKFKKKILDDLQNEGYIDAIRDKIKDDQTFPTSYYGSALEKQDAGTGIFNN